MSTKAESSNKNTLSKKKASKKTTKTSKNSSPSLKEQLKQEKGKFLRLFAEFENFKKRNNKERIDLFKTAGTEIMLALIPVLDDFNRAEELYKKQNNQNALKGILLIKNKLLEILKSKGLEEINVNPEDAFDSDIHEAISQIPTPEEKFKDKIIDIIDKGYALGGKTIRYPKVVIGK